MGYKLTLDHTLAIENIHDIITVDIKPDTTCSVTGSDVEIHGYLRFDGSYLTDELGEERFSGSIPLDITLPHLGGEPDVRTEILSFDYRVAGGESLTLNLEILLNGYEASTLAGDIHTDVRDAWIDPIGEEPAIKEAVIEPFDFISSAEEAIAVPVTAPSIQPEAAISKTGERMHEKVVEEAEPSMTTQQLAAEQVAMPLSKMMEIDTRDVDRSEIELETTLITQEPREVVSDDPQPAQEAKPIPEVQRRSRKLTNSAAALMDELFAGKRGTAIKEQMKTPHDDKSNLEEVSEADVSEPIDASVEGRSNQVEVSVSEPIDASVEGRSNQVEVSVADVSEPIDASVEGRSNQVEVSEADVSEPIDASVEEIIEENNDVELIPSADASDSVARQFADGASTIKMVYVRHESDTLGGVLERYSAKMDDVWNLPDLADGVDVGDCVMIKYEKPI